MQLLPKGVSQCTKSDMTGTYPRLLPPQGCGGWLALGHPVDVCVPLVSGHLSVVMANLFVQCKVF